jgi:hypothetical protein
MGEPILIRKHYKPLIVSVMLISFIVDGLFLGYQLRQNVKSFHNSSFNIIRVYSELASLLLSNTDNINEEVCDVFATDYSLIGKDEFISDFVNNDVKLSDEYFEKIATGDRARYYTDYKDCIVFTQIQRLSDTFLLNYDITFILIADINGYIYLHHSINSQKVVGNFEIDNIASRHCRI